MSLCKVLQFVVVRAKGNERKGFFFFFFQFNRWSVGLAFSGSEVDLVIKVVQFLVDGF